MVALYTDISFWFYNPLRVPSNNELQYFNGMYYIRIMKFLHLDDRVSLVMVFLA